MADTIFLDANSLEEIQNTHGSSVVPADGQYSSRLALDLLPAGVEAAGGGSDTVYVAPPTAEKDTGVG